MSSKDLTESLEGLHKLNISCFFDSIVTRKGIQKIYHEVYDLKYLFVFEVVMLSH